MSKLEEAIKAAASDQGFDDPDDMLEFLNMQGLELVLKGENNELHDLKNRYKRLETSWSDGSADYYRRMFVRNFVANHSGYVIEPNGRGGYEQMPLTPGQLWEHARSVWDAKPEDM